MTTDPSHNYKNPYNIPVNYPLDNLNDPTLDGSSIAKGTHIEVHLGGTIRKGIVYATSYHEGYNGWFIEYLDESDGHYVYWKQYTDYNGTGTLRMVGSTGYRRVKDGIIQ
jgi:hypothetical protein